jgi:hypothetical protein
MFGNDIAYTITVHEMDTLFSAAMQDETSVTLDGREFPELLLHQTLAGRK